MSLFKTITEYGVSFSTNKSERRNIVLTNLVSLTAAGVPLFVLLGRLFFYDQSFAGSARLLAGTLFLLLPIFMNRMGFVNASRVVLCWVPFIYLFGGQVVGIRESTNYQASGYLVVRYFFLGFGCFPFLVFSLKERKLIIAGLLGPFLSIVFFDPILNFFNVGYSQLGFNEASYPFNTIRVLISFFVIGFSCFFLKRLIESSEALNDKLLWELAEKNKQIREQADNEVHQLNQQLYANLQDLSEREFILNQSQRIAKIGSWEYRIERGTIFWSDEMFNIFGLDRNFDLKTENLSQILWGDESTVLINANINLLRTGQPYDLTLRSRTPLGYTKWVRIYGFPINQNGNAIGVRGVCHDITLYKEAEERLRTSEEKFSKAFHNNPDLITIMREDDYVLVDANQKVFDVLGYRREEVLGADTRMFDLFVFPSDRETYYSIYFDQRSVVYECPWRRKDGRVVHIMISSVRIQLQDKYYMMSLVKDVTDRKAAEEKFLKAFDLSPDLMVILRERDLVFVETNRKITEISGFTREEVIGYNSEQKEFALWVDQKERDEFFAAYFTNGTVFQEAKLRRKSGEVFYASISAQRIVLADEHHMIVVIRDITERKQEQEQLILSQANLNATINNTEVLIWSVDRDFKLITFNKPFAAYVKKQYGIDIAPGSTIFRSSGHPAEEEMVSKWSKVYLRVLAGEIITMEETRFGIDFQYSLSPIIEGNHVVGVSIFADNISERKAHDRALAEANKKVAELKLMALRSAMSPHFVFNVLNSIQYYIAKNDRLNAINYLSTFSKLIRSILNHSVNNKIKLSDEIEMLKNYVQLEMTRFENKFNFILDVDPEVDIDTIEIPSLLIQPYVENAILHGLYKKQNQGTLRIRINETEGALVFEIEDDGIGREAAIKLRKENFPTHKSMGIKLTEERLRLINEYHRAAFEIEDLVNENGPCGTRVRISVPV
ncbi:MAG TPA: PAS domain S-box protein [Chryseolinea sp.]